VEIGILGGGIAGLSVALALHQQGYQPRVYERRAEPATMGAGVTLWPNAALCWKSWDCCKTLRPLAVGL
jgi:2-polyprenyl-6-methoxyphenol hydroxylase-like FAD-dependent oxidoreductase